jgi:hypothetical protein
MSFLFLVTREASMSRATIILLLIVIAIVAALVWLSHRSGSVPPHHVEKVVTLNGAADASKN